MLKIRKKIGNFGLNEKHKNKNQSAAAVKPFANLRVV